MISEVDEEIGSCIYLDPDKRPPKSLIVLIFNKYTRDLFFVNKYQKTRPLASH